MKRVAVPAIGGVLFFVVLCLVAPVPAAGLAGSQLEIPRLFRGFRPFPPDAAGLSPSGRFLVRRSAGLLEVFDLRKDRRRFIALDFDDEEIGFSGDESRLFLLAPGVLQSRLRMASPVSGRVLADLNLPGIPELESSFSARVNLALSRGMDRTEVVTFNENGRTGFRRSFSGRLEHGFSSDGRALMFAEERGGGDVSITVINTRTGLPTVLETASAIGERGFAPVGATFVSTSPSGRGVFQVRVHDARRGNPILHRSFFGAGRVFFTRFSRVELLAVEEAAPEGAVLRYFRTDTGLPIEVGG